MAMSISSFWSGGALSLFDENQKAGGGVQELKINGNPVWEFISSPDLLQGIECSPYQFMDNVDGRYTRNTDFQSKSNDIYSKGYTGTNTNHRYIGQKYAQKIMTQMPLVFFAPCEPVFMEDFKKDDKDRVLGSLLSGDNGALEFVMDKNAQYYGIKYAYADYYNYVNLMLTSIAWYLGIQNEKISIGGKTVTLGNANWANCTNDIFKTYFSSKENIIFFADSLSSISLSFSNNTTQSSLASMINGFTDQVNELQFLIGSDASVLNNIKEASTEAISSLSSGASSVLGKFGGSIVHSLSDTGVDTILNGGKIIFPEIWQDSQHDESYNINFKLRSPDHDNISIFLNVLKPYCLLLGLTMPRSIVGNANGYRSPFLVKCFSKGMFNINMGIIESMQIEKGEECQWNDDGLPTQMDISISVKNLYSHLAMSGYKESGYLYTNSQFQDFLANTAGLNVVQFDANIGNRIDYSVYRLENAASTFGSRKFTEASQQITNLINQVYRRLS